MGPLIEKLTGRTEREWEGVESGSLDLETTNLVDGHTALSPPPLSNQADWPVAAVTALTRNSIDLHAHENHPNASTAAANDGRPSKANRVGSSSSLSLISKRSHLSFDLSKGLDDESRKTHRQGSHQL